MVSCADATVTIRVRVTDTEVAMANMVELGS